MRAWIIAEKSYKQVFKRLIDESDVPRGQVSKLADFIGCQRSYLSQALHGKAHLNKDQVWAACQYFGLNDLERKYQGLLYDHDRASTPGFRKQIEVDLQQLRSEFERIAHRFQQSSEFSPEQANFYYLSWIPSALHILSSIPEFQNLEKMSQRLGLNSGLTRAHMEKLAEMGLVELTKDHWKFAGSSKFVPKESPYVTLHHQNWRAKAIDESRDPLSDGLHFTLVQSMSRNDFARVKAMILKLIEEEKRVADPSEPEALTALTLDFFQPK